ncbi:MAG: CCR4-NOT transcription complex subunit 2 [Paramarteilia canceri]
MLMKDAQNSEFPSLSEINSIRSSANSEDSRSAVVSNNAVETQKDNIGLKTGPDFGMRGLMAQIKQANPSMSSNCQGEGLGISSNPVIAPSSSNQFIFSPGIELTSLGVNLDLTNAMHESFPSPFIHHCSMELPFDALTPPEYAVDAFLKDAMHRLKVERLPDETLFFLFYTKPGDYLQLVASTALHKHGWMFHKKEKLWFKKTLTGNLAFFDIKNWQEVIRESSVDWSAVEKEPPLSYSQIENLWLGQHNKLLQKRITSYK